MIRLTLRPSDGTLIPVDALVDTGAEVNLVRRGLVSDSCLHVGLRPVRILAANQMTLGGNHRQLSCDLLIAGEDEGTHLPTIAALPLTAYDADIDLDLILSYEWLAAQMVDVFPRNHGVRVELPGQSLWVPGQLAEPAWEIPNQVHMIQSSPDGQDQQGSALEVPAGAQQPSENYAVRTELYDEFCQRLRLQPTRDCFADQANTRCPNFYTMTQDAMTQPWDPQEVLWMNPPWRLWPEAADKLLESKCTAVCVLPAWSKPWVWKLVCAASRHIYVEAGTRLFVKEGRKCASTQWGTWVLRIDGTAHRNLTRQEAVGNVLLIPRWRTGKVPRAEGTGTELACVTASQERNKVVRLLTKVLVKRALDLFSGTGSVGSVLHAEGYEVVSVDNEPQFQPSLLVDVLTWDYRAAYPSGYFDIIFCCPPCTQFSRALTTGQRDLEGADRLVEKALEIVRYFQPRMWFLENPRGGLLKTRSFMQGLDFIDVDYCQFAEWGYQKPTRIWGGPHLRELSDRLCDWKTCPNLVDRPNGWKGHREMLGGPHLRITRNQKYRVPERLVRYLCGFQNPSILHKVIKRLRHIRAQTERKKIWGQTEDEYLEDLAKQLQSMGCAEHFVRRVVFTDGPVLGPEVDALRTQLVEEFRATVFDTKVRGPPPVRGPHGEATIELKPNAAPVKQRMFQIHGPRREAWEVLIDKLIADGKLEDGISAWCSSSFPVPKKRPGEYRLVVDFRALNDVTITDAHPLPRIEDILLRQGKYHIWSVLDMKDGYHQVPLKKEHRPLTCMSTPRGPKQWTVLVMGLKNGGAIFQRVMEWVLRDLPCADVYIDDVIVGSEGKDQAELLANHARDLRLVLERLAENSLRVDPAKAKMFVQEVEFCGHLLREGRRSPAPGKLLSIQKWELPRTVTQLRGFLGLTNYYSGYVPHYAELAAPLLAKLQLNRIDGKKGSKKPVIWSPEEAEAFEHLKTALAERLELFRVEPDKPFVLRADASDKAVGAVLEQEREVAPGETKGCACQLLQPKAEQASAELDPT